MSDSENQDYGRFLHVIKKSIRSHQLEAMRAVNRELVALYWEIGKAIQRKQERLGWGKAVVETLAKDLQAEFPGRNGFSARNLWDMKNLYASYASLPKLRKLVAVLGWGVNLLIMRRCKDELEREFYLKATAQNNWTNAVLQHQLAGENPPIGILVCHSKNKTVVEYALQTTRRAIGVASYPVVPPFPEDYRDQLPSPEAIAAPL